MQKPLQLTLCAIFLVICIASVGFADDHRGRDWDNNRGRNDNRDNNRNRNHNQDNNWRRSNPCTYPNIWSPVCGTNRVTYNNIYAFNCAVKQLGWLKVWSYGQCWG